MRKGIKILISIFIVLCVSVSSLTITEFSAFAKTQKKLYGSVVSGDFTYVLDSDGTARITKYNGTDTDVGIPENIDGYTVKRIGALSPDGGYSFLYGDENHSAFGNYQSVKSVYVPDSVTEIWDYAFSYCDNLTSVRLSNNLRVIGNYSFTNCSSLQSIDLPKSVRYILSMAFYQCSSLESFTFPDYLEYLECDAVAYTPWFSKQPNEVLYIGNFLLNCKKRNFDSEPIVIKEGTTDICSYAFSGRELSGVVFPESLRRIYDYAFRKCRSLTSIEFSGHLEYIGKDAFYESAWYDALPDEDIYADNVLLKAGSSNAECHVREGTASVAYHAFYEMNSLKSIYFPKSLAYFTSDYIEKCNNLNKIVFAEGIERIGGMQLDYVGIYDVGIINCPNLNYIVIPESTTKFYAYPFGFSYNKNLCGFYDTHAEEYAEILNVFYLGIGDMDSDNQIDVNDVTLIQKNIARLVEFDDTQSVVADVNGDGAINIIDATALQKKISGLS